MSLLSRNQWGFHSSASSPQTDGNLMPVITLCESTKEEDYIPIVGIHGSHDGLSFGNRDL